MRNVNTRKRVWLWSYVRCPNPKKFFHCEVWNTFYKLSMVHTGTSNVTYIKIQFQCSHILWGLIYTNSFFYCFCLNNPFRKHFIYKMLPNWTFAPTVQKNENLEESVWDGIWRFPPICPGNFFSEYESGEWNVLFV